MPRFTKLVCSFVLSCLFFAFSTSGAPAQNYQGMDPQTSESDPHLNRDVIPKKFPAFVGSYWKTRTYSCMHDVEKGHEGMNPGDPESSHIPDKGIPGLGGTEYKKKTDPALDPVRVAATGRILPTGQYTWDGRTGVVPNPTLAMPGYVSPFNTKDSGWVGPYESMQDAVHPIHNLRSTSITNAEFAMIMAARSELINELRAQPDRWKESMRWNQEAKQSLQSNLSAQTAYASQSVGLGIPYQPPGDSTEWDPYDKDNPLYLFNMANEATWVPCDSEAAFKDKCNFAWMVGQMYKRVYIPMAILFMLPGAIMTQARIVAKTGFLTGPQFNTHNDPDMVSPWTGILRASIAVFLIPATQLIISYAIDVGNSLTFSVDNYGRNIYPGQYLKKIHDWLDPQEYDVSAKNDMNHIQNYDDINNEGKNFFTDKNQAHFEKQNYLTSTNQQWYNTLSMLFSMGIATLNDFQIVFMFYLFLLGPIAAALFAWPGVNQEAFKKVFSNWLDGVFLLATWKFWWCIILLIIAIRYDVLHPNITDVFEMYMAGAFAALLMYVPFHPFDFRPGEMVTTVLSQAQSQTSKGGSGAAAGGSASGAGGSVSGGKSGGSGAGKPGGG